MNDNPSPLSPEEIKARMLEALAEPGDGWMYLSFADDDRGGFLGAAIVQANNVVQGVAMAHLLGISPGGQVLGLPVPTEGFDAKVPPAYRNRLLSKADLAEIFDDLSTVGELEGEA